MERPQVTTPRVGLPETQCLSILPCSPSPQLPVAGSRLCLYEDGTELTGDYFWSVPDNSELVLLTSGQTWQGCKWRRRGRAAVKLHWLWRCWRCCGQPPGKERVFLLTTLEGQAPSIKEHA